MIAKKITINYMLIVFGFIMMNSVMLPTAKADVIGIVATSITVEEAIKKLIDEAKDVIKQLESAVALNQFQIRQSLSIIIDELTFKLKELEGKTFSDLNNIQREFFTQSEATIHEAARAATAPLNQVQQITDRVNAAVARLPFADRSPRIFQVTPAYKSQLEKNFEIIIKGSELNHGAVSLTFNGKPCKLLHHIDSAIKFRYDLVEITESHKVVPLIGNLEIDLYRSTWGRIGGIFNKDRPKKSYRVMVQLIPPILGSYSVQAIYMQYSQQTRPQTGQVSAQNNFCVNGYNTHGPFLFSVLSGPGWTIIPGSIHPGAEISGHGNRNLIGPSNVTDTGFAYHASLRNTGRCFGPIRDGRAWLTQWIHWSERGTVSTQRTLAVDTGALAWGKDVSISLPPNVQSFTVTVNQIDGTRKIMIKADNSQKWFRLDSDATMRTIVLCPRPLDEALR
jgi:hypothetical protein